MTKNPRRFSIKKNHGNDHPISNYVRLSLRIISNMAEIVKKTLIKFTMVSQAQSGQRMGVKI